MAVAIRSGIPVYLINIDSTENALSREYIKYYIELEDVEMDSEKWEKFSDIVEQDFKKSQNLHVYMTLTVRDYLWEITLIWFIICSITIGLIHISERGHMDVIINRILFPEQFQLYLNFDWISLSVLALALLNTLRRRGKI